MSTSLSCLLLSFFLSGQQPQSKADISTSLLIIVGISCSIVFYTLGAVSILIPLIVFHCQKRPVSTASTTAAATGLNNTFESPVYEDIGPKLISVAQKKQFELEQNMAYGYFKWKENFTCIIIIIIIINLFLRWHITLDEVITFCYVSTIKTMSELNTSNT